MNLGYLLIILIGAHFLADFPLQGDYLAKAKNRHGGGISGTPWWIALGGHAFIHGAVVTLITGFWILGLCEILLHILIDDLKCAQKISYIQDQLLHIACKIIYAFITLYLTAGTILI